MCRVDVRRIAYALIAGLLWGVPTEVVYLMGGTEALVYLSWIPADSPVWPAVPALLGVLAAIVVYAILGWKPKRAAGASHAEQSKRAVAASHAEQSKPAAPASPNERRKEAGIQAGQAAAGTFRTGQPKEAPAGASSGKTSRSPRHLPWLHFAFDLKHVLALAALIFACWLPVLVLMYPCSMNPDTTEQLFEFQTSAPTYYPWLGEYVDAEFVDHHPVFDTLLYGGITLLGDAIGSYNHAFFLFILAQGALGALGLAASCCYASRLGTPRSAVLALAFLCAFLPIYPRFMGVVLKDSTFALCWVPFLLCYLECFRTRGEALRSVRFIILFVLMAGLCLLTKKLGAFIVLPSLVVLVIACVLFARGDMARRRTHGTALWGRRRGGPSAQAASTQASPTQTQAAPVQVASTTMASQTSSAQTTPAQTSPTQAVSASENAARLRDRLWFRAATSLAAVVLVFAVAFPAVVYPLVGGVAPGGKQEALGFAFQQVVAVIRDNPSSVSPEEYAAVDKVLDVPAACEDFKPFLTDYVKKHYRNGAATEDLIAFVGAWATIGMKNPVLYGKTSLHCVYRMLVPSSMGGAQNYQIPGKQFDERYHRANDTQQYIEENSEYHLSLKRPAALIAADSQLRQVQETISELPIISLISTLGFYGGMLPLSCLLLVLYHRRRLAWAYAPVLLSVFFLLLSPTAATRYILPLAFSAPLIVGWAYHAAMQAKVKVKKSAQ